MKSDTQIYLRLNQAIKERVVSDLKASLDDKLVSFTSSLPGRLKEQARISISKQKDKLTLTLSMPSPLAGLLDSGQAYKKEKPPSLAAIKRWAAYRGIEGKALPIWLSIKKRGPKRRYTNWIKQDLIENFKGLLK
ncbi:hypothetical protein F0310_04380 (plasmid) [Borrelia sp. A-FGy1]|uniref:hypothetical protein n=1 Tax=Borrelia sp. A-FGy1 TaxID=2608247 RepID=UPI0015F40FD7|nr:hypothetical protein [Borrelia sp. A-FGy1]QMU99654.1 hypothetical protein F0310_04380 [Borrelia sp. A-FGy1]